MDLWHVSEREDITVFQPRVPPNADAGVTDPVVWAVSNDRLPNYLLPRDCPRVCFWIGQDTTSGDRTRFFLTESTYSVAIEPSWMNSARATSLFLYKLPTVAFNCIDANAGYFVSAQSVVPLSRHVITDLPGSFHKRGVELRTEANLRGFGNQVVKSTLCFSLIRMRNARFAPNAA